MSITNQEIIDSTAFKILNHMIDEKAQFIEGFLPFFKDEVNRLFDTAPQRFIPRLGTRTFEEGDASVTLPVGLPELKQLVDGLGAVFRAEDQLRELQRQKLRLLNDYDFTATADEQKKIFG